MVRPAYSEDERERIAGQIRQAALHLFDSKGYRNVSLRAIAGRLNWSATALYSYYESKKAMLAAIRVSANSRQNVVQNNAVSKGKQSAVECVASCIFGLTWDENSEAFG